MTGGGGSIGGELCRRLAAARPKKLVILDICENGAYDVMCDIAAEGVALGEPLCEVCVEIASVFSEVSMGRVFAKHRPQIVFHAAAHKHVPLMESCPVEAVLNNVVGTYNCMELSKRYGVERFLLISTDKAVNPTSVMGATKRACEIMLSSFAKESETVYSCVRFGNVIGSAGSVVPLFRRQIERGGPVTLTDRRVTRYLMTIPAAVDLVVTVCMSAKRGGLFLLDMGEPVRIIDLAERLIREAGLEPYKDIDIIETGLRPGEKLTEQLTLPDCALLPTETGGVFEAAEKGQPLSESALREKITVLRLAADFGRDDIVLEMLKWLVPNYTPHTDISGT